MQPPTTKLWTIEFSDADPNTKRINLGKKGIRQRFVVSSVSSAEWCCLNRKKSEWRWTQTLEVERREIKKRVGERRSCAHISSRSLPDSNCSRYQRLDGRLFVEFSSRLDPLWHWLCGDEWIVIEEDVSVCGWVSVRAWISSFGEKTPRTLRM